MGQERCVSVIFRRSISFATAVESEGTKLEPQKESVQQKHKEKLVPYPLSTTVNDWVAPDQWRISWIALLS